MARYLPALRLLFILVLILLLAILLVSACNVTDLLGGRTPGGPTQFDILAPAANTVLVRSPVQIQSAHPGDNISRVELRVTGPDGQDKLLRSDVPQQGYLLQEWTPQEPGTYTVRVLPYSAENANNPITTLTKTFEVTESLAVVDIGPDAGPTTGAAFTPPTLTPTIEPIPPQPTEVVATPVAGEAAGAATAEAAVAVAAVQVVPSPTPTPKRRYPPPPPAPGVPPGPVASDPDYGPPACDAAEYLGPFTANTARRVVITEPDDVAAKVVGGTSVFRAWRLRNIGLCTWGPGYELAFYGGRSMGSGGVAFESTFPAEPPRRNVIVDPNQLIVPEGRPNEIAVLELRLNAPATPGIHQSYWRMRNPAGIYFGPILGVTLEVVRECRFGVYGAPVINKFEIIGVGNVYQPDNPVSVLAQVGEPVTLEWNIINANSFDIVFEDPTGNIQSISTTDPSGRATFPCTRVGGHTITLYAENGPCVAEAQVLVECVPPADEQFNFEITLSSSSACASTQASDVAISSEVEADNVTIQWQHFDEEVNQFSLVGQSLKRTYSEECFTIFGWDVFCSQGWGAWTPVGDPVDVVITEDGASAGTATIANMERKLLNACNSSRNQQCAIRYVMEAKKNGRPAEPPTTQPIDVLCSPAPTTELPTEIRDAGATFNPN